jgi:hypothetical protein
MATKVDPTDAEMEAFGKEWEAAREKSWSEYHDFGLALRLVNDPALVEAYERDGDDDRESCFLSSLWIALLRWKVLKTKTFRSGGKKPLRLPPVPS